MSASAWIQRDDLDRAIADFTMVIRLDPTIAAAHYARGRARTTNGEREQAVADLAEAVRLSPLDKDMIFALKQLKPDYESPTDSLDRLRERVNQ